MTLPTIAIFTGDPAGIGPELVQKLLDAPQTLKQATVTLIAQRGALAAAAGVRWHDWPGASATAFPLGVASADNGRFLMQGLAEGARLAASGQVDAFCFAPLNKGALRLGGMRQEDELRWFAEFLNHTGVCGELNVLKNLWTARVTSHVALKEVSVLLTPQGVANAIQMITEALKASGIARPRVAVCGLNPHNGDNGNFGDEEGRIIEPGVQLAARQGFPADGPFPADTAFVRAIRAEGGYDGVVTMYHDQGQIAMKLMGFEQGVTVHGGLPVAITTPAHGTAYDIAGRGLATPTAMFNAFDLACRMGQSRRLARASSTHPKETLS
jgi:4-hydroxy-L-threonine phosphate dehydrogenase PdxA